MSDFENKQIMGIHVSRYIASWRNAGGSNFYHVDSEFDDWLKQLSFDGKRMTDEDRRFIRNFAECGKLELEYDAKSFIKLHTPKFGDEELKVE